MSNRHFGLQEDPFADAHELTVAEATQLLRGRITAAGGDGTRLFPDETCAELHRLSSGRRGGIFALAGRAMKIAARAGAMRIEPAHVQTGASEAGHDAARAVARRDESSPPAPMSSAGDAEAGFVLPNQPSPDLDPGAREWVGRFMAMPGPGIAPAPGRGSAAAEEPKPARAAAAKATESPSPIVTAKRAPAAPPPEPTREQQAAAQPTGPATPDAAPPRATQLSPATSARLREGPRSRTRRQRALVQGAVAAAAVIALVIVVMNRMPTTPPAATRVPAAAVAPAPTVGPAVPPAASATTAKPEANVSAAAPSVPPPAEPAESERVGLEVATYIFRERAEDERVRLVAAGYHARVKTAWENGSASYRVIVGPYRSWAAAERAADELLESGMVGQARAIRLEERSRR